MTRDTLTTGQTCQMLLIAVLLSLAPGMLLADTSKVSPWVANQATSNETVSVLIRMHEQVDHRSLDMRGSALEKRTTLVNTLRRVAAESQKDLIEKLKAGSEE